MLSPFLPRLSYPATVPTPPFLLAAPSRAAELLTAAAAHRAFVEHCLWKWDQQQTGHQLAEMVEGWVTGEDAVEVALWHIEADTTSPAHGKRARTGTAPARGPGPVPGSIAHRQSAQPLAHRRWNQAQVAARRQEVREQVEPSREPGGTRPVPRRWTTCSSSPPPPPRSTSCKVRLVAAEQEQRLCRLLALRAGCSVAVEQEQRLLWGKRPPPHSLAALTPSPHKIPRASLAGSVPWTVAL